jgi:hypothetical protein
MAKAAHFTGKNVKTKFFIAGISIGDLDVKSFSAKPNITSINDGVCGEDRDRLDNETNFYEIKLSCFQRDLSKFSKLLVDQDLIDEGGIATDKEFAFVIKAKDGSKKGYQCSEAVFDDWNLDVGGRTERGMLEIPIRCRYIKEVSL